MLYIDFIIKVERLSGSRGENKGSSPLVEPLGTTPDLPPEGTGSMLTLGVPPSGTLLNNFLAVFFAFPVFFFTMLW